MLQTSRRWVRQRFIIDAIRSAVPAPSAEQFGGVVASYHFAGENPRTLARCRSIAECVSDIGAHEDAAPVGRPGVSQPAGSQIDKTARHTQQEPRIARAAEMNDKALAVQQLAYIGEKGRWIRDAEEDRVRPHRVGDDTV